MKWSIRFLNNNIRKNTFDILRNLGTTTFSILRIIRSIQLKRQFPLIDNNDRECVVIGTGPSLTATLTKNVDFFLPMPKLCVNDIVLSSYFEQLQPEYYTFFDPAYFDEQVSLKFKRDRERILKDLIQKTKWPMTLFLPLQAQKNRDFKDISSNNSNINIVFINNTLVDGFVPFRHLIYKLNLGMPRVQNILVAGIFLMLNMGYKKIYTIGADHSWHEDLILDNENKVCLKLGHCYDEKEVDYVPFFMDAQEKQTFKMHELFDALSATFKGYYYLRQYADYLEATIINASNKTYIDAFERLKL